MMIRITNLNLVLFSAERENFCDCQIKITGEYFAYSKQAFDIDTQNEILRDVWDRQNLDFSLTEKTEDEETRNIIRET